MVLKNKLFGITLSAAMILASASLARAGDDRAVVRDSSNHVVVNTFNNCVRTDWPKNHDTCGANARAPIQQVARTTEAMTLEARTLYFEFDKSDLTAATKIKLNTLAEGLKSDSQVKEAKIVGYADRIGREHYNDALSQRRATNVQNYLNEHGFINSRVTETRWFGDKVPVTHCAKGLARGKLIECLAKDRRVEVEIEYQPVH